MKITVLSGSPKGDLSITLQYVNYIQKKFPEVEMSVHHISQRIKGIEKNPARLDEILSDIENSDGVLWAVPLYVFLVPSQYKRFIEIIFERGAASSFKNKHAAVLTTSIHFYDHTANNYMRAICDDLDMRFVEYLSADMNDIFKEEGRNQLELFGENFFEAIRSDAPTTKAFQPLTISDFSYSPSPGPGNVVLSGKKIAVITDSTDPDSNISRMVDRFISSISGEVTLKNLHDLDIKGGCLGCCECAFDYRCVYTGKDEFIDFYNDTIPPSDILVYAGTMTDRYLSSKWKQFFDRRFFNNHTPTQVHKQVAYIISGPLAQVPNLREIVTAGCELEFANLVDMVTDECEDSGQIDSLLTTLAGRLVRNAEQGWIKPSTFLGIGGRKIFRDDIWGKMRFPFLADHAYYESHGYYDFPQDKPKELENSIKMIEAIENPETREAVRKMIKTQMVAGHKKLVDSI